MEMRQDQLIVEFMLIMARIVQRETSLELHLVTDKVPATCLFTY